MRRLQDAGVRVALATDVGGELRRHADDARRIERVPDGHVDADRQPLDGLERSFAVRVGAALRPVDLVAQREEAELVDRRHVEHPPLTQRLDRARDAVRPDAHLPRQDRAHRLQRDDAARDPDQRDDAEHTPAPLGPDRLEDPEDRRPPRRAHENTALPDKRTH